MKERCADVTARIDYLLEKLQYIKDDIEAKTDEFGKVYGELKQLWAREKANHAGQGAVHAS